MKIFMKSNKRGFTLIELVIVIIILAILAAVALPKFIDLQGDAREAVIKEVSGTIHAFDNLVYAKAAILGIETNDRNSSTTSQDTQGGFFVDGNFVLTIHGHPWLFDGPTLSNLLDADVQFQTDNTANANCVYSGDFCAMMFNGPDAPGAIGIPFSPGNAVVIYNPNSSVDDQCFAYYIFDRADNGVQIGAVTSGCQ
ncbi:hypothetical protein GCM10007916_13880 [Psychromonas marina]|uniref:Prepilin-type N-terminal cleavage/methylation domain-containing protein n=1 Tax=Psychromonas marina TaxID=88364 RepID=A0ABQ6DYS5_9GAMM|nr:prepilin-type N-terminal cleavage/methylation domain-containing protein [Psychromonas marina]GLS90321.1 hypothetical protein GCM10007916_13880 [Psychromonas marina]